MPASVKRIRDAKLFEQQLAEDLGGRRIFLSGAGTEKADVRRAKSFHINEAGRVERTELLAFRGEAKTTRYDSYAFKTTDWFDLHRAASAAGEIPVFAIWFLRCDEGLAIAPRVFVQELELGPSDDTVLPVQRSLVLRPAAHNELRMAPPQRPGASVRPALLTVVPYTTFIEAVHAHAHYAPTRTSIDEHTDTP